jgi:hypothetical protein
MENNTKKRKKNKYTTKILKENSQKIEATMIIQSNQSKKRERKRQL